MVQGNIMPQSKEREPQSQTSQHRHRQMYDKKRREYEQKQTNILKAMQKHSDAHKDFHITASVVLDLAKRAYDIFEKATIQEKRQLIDFVFQNCTLHNKKLNYKLKSPFDIIVDSANCTEWLPILDYMRTDWLKDIKELGHSLKEVNIAFTPVLA